MPRARGALALMLLLATVTSAQPGDAGVPAPPAGPPPLIPRALLLGNPERLIPQLSPDGKRLAFIAPDERGVLQVWVRTLGQAVDTRLTQDKQRGIRQFSWAEDSQTVLFAQDVEGDENFHVFGIDLPSGNVRDFTPWQGVRAGVLGTHPRFPDTLLVTANVRDRKVMDVWRVNLKTGATELDTQNPGDVSSWRLDTAFTVRGAIATTKEGGTEVRIREGARAPWRAFITTGLEEDVDLLGFSLDGKSTFVTTSISAETSRLVEKGVRSGSERVLTSNPTQDVDAVWMHPSKGGPLAVRFDVDGKPAWTVVDGNVASDFQALEKQLGTANFQVLSLDRADATWVVSVATDLRAPEYVLWERKARRLTRLFSVFPKLDGAVLSPMKPVTLPVSGGYTMTGYLTQPAGFTGPRPLVLLVHGGPWGRDTWGFRGDVQLLANRGYAVLQVNFRGSTGFGKRFLNAGNKQWGLDMQADLSAAVQWAKDQGVSAPGQVAIMGASYGGYATLAGLAFTPDLFRCGVDAVGPSNLLTLLASFPPYWSSFQSMMLQRVGDPAVPADKELLTRASPLFSADQVKAPLLLGQGAHDPRVKQVESEQMFDALAKRNVLAEYVLYPDEGHGFARPENRLDFSARTELFLARCLAGGRFEPMPVEGKVAGSSAVVKRSGVTPRR